MSYPVSRMSRSVCRHLLASAATLTIATSALPRPAAAQSFKGTPTVTAGGATVNTSPNNTTVNINAPLTVINWRPDDNSGTGDILFQPAGTTALFQSINFQDFTVLNRILPVDINGAPVITRPIRFDGTVNSQFGAISATIAGGVWFYTPGGIILGAGSAFNVGSLVLSTSDINTTNMFVGNNGTINFTGTPNPSSAITLENGAQVNALINGSSYVAMVAPRIEQNGTIQVNGSAALVGAEAVDITMDGPSGLFDITVSTGTGDANGVVHGATGVTSGPASAGAGDTQRIYIMAIPKNTAISMLVNGNVGYTPAASASVQNGDVVLSAGYNIANGDVELGEHATPVSTAAANIIIGDTSNQSTSFTSRVVARASGNLFASPGSAINGPSFLNFSSNAFLFGDISSVVEASNRNEIIGAGGDLFVSSRRAGQGGNAFVRALGGLVGVGGDLTVDASSIGFSGQSSGISLANLNGANGRGGNASINVVGGNLRISGTTQVLARGVGGFGRQSMGSGFGGNAAVNLSGTTAIAQLTGGLEVHGGGYGVLSYLALFGVTLDVRDPFDGGHGFGGSAAVIINDINQLTLPSLIINASGNGDAGGSETNGRGGNGGNGTGGTASLTLNNEALALPDLVVEASGFGGDGGRSENAGEAAGNGGAGAGGTATINLTGSADFGFLPGFSSAMIALANGRGGRGGDATIDSTLDSGSGGAGNGGTASIAVGGSSQVDVGTISSFANGTSGYVGTGSTNFGGTGVAMGGNASIAINTSGAIDANLLSATANAITVETSKTSDASAGTANIAVLGGTATVEEINVYANAYLDTETGQNVGSINGVSAGTNTGGTATLSVVGGTLTANRAFVTATGVGSGHQRDSVFDVDPNSPIEQALAGGAGVGGQATFSISGGSGSFAEMLLLDSSGWGGNGYINADSFTTQPTTSGAGGEGVGGTASLTITGGLLTVPIVDLKSEGTGGNGGDFWGVNAGNAGAGGNGTGGTTNFTAARDIFTINALTLSALGRGGTGGVSAEAQFDGSFLGYGTGAATGGAGGTGLGGAALLSLDFDPVLPSLIIDASGVGGTGSLGLVGGRGGDGFGGSGLGGARLALGFGDLTVDALIVRSNGTGGNGGEGTGGPGGAGGNGTGGDAEVLADGNGSNLTTLDVLVQANGLGGNAGIGGGASNGAAGGNAQGGKASLTISNAATGNLGATLIEAIAGGGIGSDAPAGLLGGNGGGATGGNAVLAITAATATSADIMLLADGNGGDPGIGGTGGNGSGGGASVAVTTGSFSSNDAAIRANGRGGAGGGISTGGTAAISSVGGSIDFSTTLASAEGETGSGSGGLVTIQAGADTFGTSGVMTLGNTTLSSDALGGVAGIVRINNDNGNPAGGVIRFDQLFASADGLTESNPAGGVFVRANQSDISVTGDATLFARDSIGIDGIGQGTFAAGGQILATAGTDIVITHSGQPGLVDTVRGTVVSLSADRNLDARAGSIIRGISFVDAQAINGFANVGQLFAANMSTVAAGLDATIRNATITSGSLNLSAGRIVANFPTWRRATTTILGAVTASDALLVNSGGDIVTDGATIRTGNNVIFNAGDDIVVRNSAISSAQNVTTSGDIQLNAGAITPVDALPGEIRSLVIANSALTSTGYDLALRADAIDATTASINANRLTALVNNAPAPGVAGGNDGGLLSANCVQGNICLGAVSTPTQVLVGPTTGTVGLANRVTMAGSLTSGNISVRARDGVVFSGPINVAAANSLLVSVLNGPISLTGTVNLTGVNALNLYAGAGAITGPNAALLSNGNIGLFANNGIVLGSIDTAGVLNTVANDGSVTAAGSLVTPGSVTVNGLLAVRGGAANINSGGGISTGSILSTAGNDVLLTSVGAQSLGTVNAGRDLVVNAASLNASAVAAQRNVSVTVGGTITLGTTTAGNDILLSSGGAQALGATTAGRDVMVNAASLNAASIAAPRNVSVSVTGSATVGNTSGALITMRAGQDVSFTGTATATTAIDLGANGLATFSGVASAPNITVRSGNIAIGATGRLGTIGTTQTVTLTNSAGAQMTIGGSGVTGGYSLSDAEIARIFGDNIDIGWTGNLANTGAPTAPPAGGFTQPSIVVGALTLSSRAGNVAGNLAANGALSIRTPGTMQVNGTVVLNNAGNANTLRLTADQSLQIIAGQGSITIRDGANALAGTLDLSSANIIAASASAMADIAGQTDERLIDTRLGLNDGFVSDTGILSANIVNLNGGSNVFVQNTGNSSFFRDRRGITANAINVSLINPNGLPNANGLIIINGRITAAPNFATGLTAIPLLSINGVPSQTSTGFDTLSTMNGCQITALAACRQRENPVSITDDDINQPLDPDQPGNNQFPTALIEVKEFETFGYPPLIDEPVTGSGNDDLWPATCDPDEETCPTSPIPAPQ